MFHDPYTAHLHFRVIYIEVYGHVQVHIAAAASSCRTSCAANFPQEYHILALHLTGARAINHRHLCNVILFTAIKILFKKHWNEPLYHIRDYRSHFKTAPSTLTMAHAVLSDLLSLSPIGHIKSDQQAARYFCS